MRIPRIHVAQAMQPGRDIELPSQASTHIARVLRLQCGHRLNVFDGEGNEYAAEVVSLAKHVVTVRVTEPIDAINRESPLRITLAHGIARGDKMDWILQKATELGVTRIVPLVTERTEVRLDAERRERRLAHWRSVIIAACEQCGRNRVPDLDTPLRLADWLATGLNSQGLRLALDPEGELSVRTLSPHNAATLVIGPEGGLSAHDMAALAQAGFLSLRLGPRILRTETAGIAALAALQTLHGDL